MAMQPACPVSDTTIAVAISPASDVYLPARRVWQRYGVTDMTLYRWLRDDRMRFPQPLYLGRFRYWRLADLEAWERSRANLKAKAA